MTLEQLRLFVAVAECEHVTRAAANPSSHPIGGIRRHRRPWSGSGVSLFHRVGRRIQLTEEGRVFLAEARAVLAQADAAERALSDLAGLKRGTFR